jgi:hypothetical protein
MYHSHLNLCSSDYVFKELDNKFNKSLKMWLLIIYVENANAVHTS